MTALAFLCGLALALAYPRAGLAPFAWLAPVPWLAMTIAASPRRALLQGYLFGLGFFGLLLAWVQRVLAHYTSLPFILSAPIWALLIGYLAIYPALFGGLLSASGRRWGVKALWLAPPLWVGLELVRGFLIGGFPWGLAGYAHGAGLALLQCASVGGIALVSFVLVAAWSALTVLLVAAAGDARGAGPVPIGDARVRGRGWRPAIARCLGFPEAGAGSNVAVSRGHLIVAGLTLAGVVVTIGLGAARLHAHPVANDSHGGSGESKHSAADPGLPASSLQRPGGVVARGAKDGAVEMSFRLVLVQGGFGGDLDYDQATAALKEYQRLSLEAARSGPALIVWPESNVPFQPERSPDYLHTLEELSRRTGAPLLLGAVGGAPETGLTNSAYWIDETGIRGRYDKRRLVQYGEYVPLQGVFPFIRKFVPEAGEFLAGHEVGLFRIDGMALGISICYEMIFPEEIRLQARAGAQLLVNLTNDSWYSWAGPWQHAEFSIARAVETGLWTVRCASTGRSLVIDPWGRVVEHGPLGGAALIESEIPAVPAGRIGGRTVSVRWGDWVGTGCVTISAAALAFLGVGNIIDKRRSKAFIRRQRDPRR